MTFAECVLNVVYLHGDKKYRAVTAAFRDYVTDLNKILIFDAIIYNKDRHLNNLALVNNRLVLFDNGASLFSRDSSAKLAFNSYSFNYQPCKPFYNTTGKQLSLCTNTFS